MLSLFLVHKVFHLSDDLLLCCEGADPSGETGPRRRNVACSESGKRYVSRNRFEICPVSSPAPGFSFGGEVIDEICECARPMDFGLWQ